MPDYRFNNEQKFIISGYNQSKPFASFFPGIAGLHGIPMWVFYVNRGQGICSMGVENKDNAILEFQPANKAYRYASTQGFRTFIKVDGHTVYEPFSPYLDSSDQEMSVSSAELELSDTNNETGIKTEVTYFTLAEEPIPALVRRVTVTNLSKQSKRLQILDGLSIIAPYGMVDYLLKNMSRTIEAWTAVTNIENRAPFFQLRVEPGDHPEVRYLKQGNFYFALAQDGARLPLAVNPKLVFAQSDDLIEPGGFAREDFVIPAEQNCVSTTPCAMALANIDLQPGEGYTITSFIGQISDVGSLEKFAVRAVDQDFYFDKRALNQAIINDIQQGVETFSGDARFDAGIRQAYLDNVLRGGLPIWIPSPRHMVPEYPRGTRGRLFYAYSRKHGDLERDYNAFNLAPTYYSQGNGNYRDVNQNRRNDIWFMPEVGESNIKMFYSLIQTNGYNPLITKGANYHFDGDDVVRRELVEKCVGMEMSMLDKILAHPFSPGSLATLLFQNIPDQQTAELVLETILLNSESINLADFGEGYWSDHWHYNTDLLESYLNLYPDRIHDVLLGDHRYTYYDSDHDLVKREEKYCLYHGEGRQFGSVRKDSAKAALIASRKEYPNHVRSNHGKGDIYFTTLLEKIICLLVTKCCNLDPAGMGIEMEGDKPNWYDALNALPGVFGSATSEAYELVRLAELLIKLIPELSKQNKNFHITHELYQLIINLQKLLKETDQLPGKDKPMAFWYKVGALKEEYRAHTFAGVSGRIKEYSLSELTVLAYAIAERVRGELEKAVDPVSGVPYTYFQYQVTKYDLLTDQHGNEQKNKDGYPLIKPKAFKQKPLPLFLEGPVHALRVLEKGISALPIYTAVQASELYDRTLRMYKVNAPLAGESMDIGRCRVFAPGWLENESVWLHMEYKYLLELLRNDLKAEFYSELCNCLTCFQDPARYGRNPLEKSSFICSSAFPDPEEHGRGFVARLSGSTAEFIHIWLMMCVGKKPFRLDQDGQLELIFEPSIPEWLWTTEERTIVFDGVSCVIPASSFAYRFLGHTLVIYTFNLNLTQSGIELQTRELLEDGTNRVQMPGKVIPQPYADLVRSGGVSVIKISSVDTSFTDIA